jgi:hypothetical protein
MVADYIVDNGVRTDPVSADIDVARLRLQLCDLSLERLEVDGLVEWDRETNIVRKGPDFKKKHPPLRSD